MFNNTHALDALAALCGSTSTSAPPPAAAVPMSSSPSSSYALITHQLRLQEAQQQAAAQARRQQAQQAAAQAHQQQAQQQQAADQAAQQAARQAAFASVPSDILRAYLASTAGPLGSPTPTTAINVAAPTVPYHHTPSLDHSAVRLQGYGQDVIAPAFSPSLHHASTRSPDPNAEARAMAAKIFMAQQQHAQPRQQLLQQPALMAAERREQYSQRVQAAAQQPQQQQYSLPSIALDRSQAATAPLMAHPAVSSVPAMKQQYPQAVLSSKPSSPPTVVAATAPALQQVNMKKTKVSPSPTKNNKGNKHQSHAKPLGPKKRLLVRSNSPEEQGGSGGGLKRKSSTLKSVMNEWEDKKEAKRAANR